MKKINLYIYYLFSFFYLELLFKLLLGNEIFKVSFINMFIYIFFFSLLLYFHRCFFKEKGNKFLFYFFLSVICLWFAAQYVVKSFFDFYISFSILEIADQVGDFALKAILEIFKRIIQIILFFLPLIMGIIFRKKINFKRLSKKSIFTILMSLTLLYGIYYKSLEIGKDNHHSAYELYHNINNPVLNIERVGVINTFSIDLYRLIFGFEEKIILSSPLEQLIIDEGNNLPQDIEIEYNYNNLDIDFESFLNNTSDKRLKDMTEYFMNDIGTKQNAYTSFFEGKNLIFILAESFNEIAVDKNLTPTLYNLVNSGFVFENFYTPNIGSTIGGEFQELTGLYANTSSFSSFRAGENYYPMGLSNVFENKEYKTFAYHNHYYDFQDRNIYLKTMGFDNYKGCYNELEKLMNCGIWPNSDEEMFKATIKEYINTPEPFFTYYVTVSGHASYSFSGNNMARKHRDEVKDLPYSEPVRAYLATQIELENALSYLLKELENSGKLDDTVIVLVGDHYPYELTIEQINEVASYKKDEVIEVNHSNLVIWNKQMDKVKVKKVGSQIDILPTIYNLFGISYDSRLFVGKDILSPTPGLAIMGDSSWVSDYGYYLAKEGKFYPKEKVSDSYVRQMNDIVQNKMVISKYIIEKDYYKHIWGYIR